ncbi:hypothetical protein NEIRO03_2137 [Nematocida sp. AWRm78]|nr:hypothetical protein NEIRO02_2102 [Nematocida sp. AWRm79]KAI5185851.1 hypothetical protein NEIRO03_2137 [Nematocida sp. AWRm78]
MLQRKNPSINSALYGHCLYKNINTNQYNSSPVFCLVMKDLLSTLNTYLIDMNKSEKMKVYRVLNTMLKGKSPSSDFNLKDISSMLNSSNMDSIKTSSDGFISIRNNDYIGCKYGIHYDILDSLIHRQLLTVCPKNNYNPTPV